MHGEQRTQLVAGPLGLGRDAPVLEQLAAITQIDSDDIDTVKRKGAIHVAVERRVEQLKTVADVWLATLFCLRTEAGEPISDATYAALLDERILGDDDARLARMKSSPYLYSAEAIAKRVLRRWGSDEALAAADDATPRPDAPKQSCVTREIRPKPTSLDVGRTCPALLVVNEISLSSVVLGPSARGTAGMKRIGALPELLTFPHRSVSALALIGLTRRCQSILQTSS